MCKLVTWVIYFLNVYKCYTQYSVSFKWIVLYSLTMRRRFAFVSAHQVNIECYSYTQYVWYMYKHHLWNFEENMSVNFLWSTLNIILFLQGRNELEKTQSNPAKILKLSDAPCKSLAPKTVIIGGPILCLQQNIRIRKNLWKLTKTQLGRRSGLQGPPKMAKKSLC